MLWIVFHCQVSWTKKTRSSSSFFASIPTQSITRYHCIVVVSLYTVLEKEINITYYITFIFNFTTIKNICYLYFKFDSIEITVYVNKQTLAIRRHLIVFNAMLPLGHSYFTNYSSRQLLQASKARTDAYTCP